MTSLDMSSFNILVAYNAFCLYTMSLIIDNVYICSINFCINSW